MRRALLLLALALAPRPAAAESLTLAFEPHPSHATVVAGEMVPVTLRAVYDRKVALEDLEIAPSASFDWVQTARVHGRRLDAGGLVADAAWLASIPDDPGEFLRLRLADEHRRRLSLGQIPPEEGDLW